MSCEASTSDSLNSNGAVEVQLDSKYECPICLSCLKDAVLTSCGHHFCLDCIHAWLLHKSEACPIDGQKLDVKRDLFPDQYTRREILNTKTYCQFCNLELSAIDLDMHLQTHKDTFQVNGEQTVDCNFKNIGCKVKGNRSKIDEHLVQELHHHLHLLNEAYSSLSRSLPTREEKLLSVLSQESKFWEPNGKDKETNSNEVEPPWMPLMRSMFERIVILEQKSHEQSAQIENLKGTLASNNADLNYLKLQHAGGQYLWTLTNFTEKVNAMKVDKNKMFYSPGFYTSPLGYKICARVNMSHNVKGQLSLLIHIMQTPHDSSLDWPFNGRITLAIIHPFDESLTIKETMISRPGLDAFKKPIDSMNKKAFGYTEFIAVQEIWSKNFLKEDNLLIKIQVHCI